MGLGKIIAGHVFEISGVLEGASMHVAALKGVGGALVGGVGSMCQCNKGRGLGHVQ